MFPGGCVRGNGEAEGRSSLVAQLWLSLLAQDSMEVISASGFFQRGIAQRRLRELPLTAQRRCPAALGWEIWVLGPQLLADELCLTRLIHAVMRRLSARERRPGWNH